MLTQFCAMQNIRSLISITSLPAELGPFVDRFEQFYGPDIRGTVGDDIYFSESSQECDRVTERSGQGRGSSRGSPVSRVTRKRQDFSIFDTEILHNPDSFVVFKVSHTGSLCYGRIKAMHVTGSEIEVRLQQYQVTSWKYGVLIGRFEPEEVLVPLSKVICHFIPVPLDTPPFPRAVLAISLDKGLVM